MTQYDYIIVGAGSAGCVLANRLTENPRITVLLLEAGEADQGLNVQIPAAFPKLFKTARDWNYEAEGVGTQAQYWPRGKMLGGSSAMNAMMYVRGNMADFDHWRDLGNEGWGYTDVLPYFKRAEHQERGGSTYHGTGGPLNVADQRCPNPLSHVFIKAGEELGLTRNDDVNGAVQEGIGLAQVTQKFGRRWSASDAYLKPILHRSNLTVQTEAHLLKICIEGKRTVGVEYKHEDTKIMARVRREVLLCAGAINSPQSLMLSGIGPAEHLKRHGISVIVDLPGVGQNLQDHPAFATTYQCRQPITLAAAEKLPHLLNYLLRRKGPLTSNVAEGVAFIKSRPDVTVPDLEWIFLPAFFMAHGAQNPPGHGFTVASVLLRPQSRGTIRLQSNQPQAVPLIQANTFSCPEDLETLVAGVKLARRLVQTRAFSTYTGQEVWPGMQNTSDEQITEFIRGHFQTTYHPVGTCKMGYDPLAVVDDHLRVHGLYGLRVIDASIFPTIIGGHPNAAVIMAAEKAADLLKNSDIQ